VREAKRVTTWEGDLTTQGALAAFLADGHHAAHVRRAARVYRERRDLVLTALDRLDDLLEIVPSVVGLHLCARFRDLTTHDREVAQRAGAQGVRVEPLSARFHDLQPIPGLSVGVGGITAEAIPDAMRRLERVIARRP
jgi:GntR family transcriptional regulator/MocR family aminotransferase